MYELDSNDLALTLNDRLQVTSGAETWNALPSPSIEYNKEERERRRLSASSITFVRLSLSMISCCDDGLFFRKLRATSPNVVSVSSSSWAPSKAGVSSDSPRIKRASVRFVRDRNTAVQNPDNNFCRRAARLWSYIRQGEHSAFTPARIVPFQIVVRNRKKAGGYGKPW